MRRRKTNAGKEEGTSAGKERQTLEKMTYEGTTSFRDFKKMYSAYDVVLLYDVTTSFLFSMVWDEHNGAVYSH